MFYGFELNIWNKFKIKISNTTMFIGALLSAVIYYLWQNNGQI
jgi:hypothetical protein